MPPAAPTVASFRFSTDDLPAGARGAAVRRLRERGLIPLEPLADHAVHVRVAKWFLPGASILSGKLAGLRQEATARAHGITDDLFFAVNLAGRSTVLQGQREITFGDGEALLLSCADGDFGVARTEPVRFVGLRMPRKHLAPLTPDVDDRTMRVVPPGAHPVKLLTGYLAALTGLHDLLSPATSRVIAAHVHDLVALSIAPTREATFAESSVRAARLRMIKSDILGSLEDCTLSVAAVAARHRVTPRYVHKLFESDGATFTRFLTERRLDRAHSMLRDQRLLTRTITSIAYDVGFNDLSHFNRAFRRRYHATPSDIRAAAGLDSTRDD